MSEENKEATEAKEEAKAEAPEGEAKAEAAAPEGEAKEAAAAEEEAPKKKGPRGPKTVKSEKEGLGRNSLKRLYRKKLAQKLKDDKEFAKGYFEGRSKRSVEKKAAYKKRHAAK